jgi:hypothetical protein
LKKAKKVAVNPLAGLPKPSEREAAAITDSAKRMHQRRQRIRVKFDKEGERTVSIGPEHNDGQGWLARLADAFGTASNDFGTSQINLISNALRTGGEVNSEAVNAALAAVDGVRPRDEIEAMLASQMVVTHSLAMEMLGRARRVDQIPQVDCAGNLAIKLLRTYTAQVEALAKLRRGGEQVVRVEHVHVHPGGQAIVGSVSHTNGARGGAFNEKDGQPDAQPDAAALVHAPLTPLRSQDAARELMPVASSERQEALPNARRRQGIGGANRKAKR